MTDPRLETLPAEGLDRFTARNGLVLVEIWAPWSGLSFLVRSVVDRLLLRRPELPVRVARVDVSGATELLGRLGLAGPPALLFFRDGTVVARHVGLITPDALDRWIDTALGDRASDPGASQPFPTE